MRLIDADALKMKLEETRKTVNQAINRSGVEGLESVKRTGLPIMVMVNANVDASILAVDKMPTVDCGVRYGRWLHNVRGDYCKVCSECGYGFPTQGYAWLDCNRASDERESLYAITDMMNYCPNCGAKMPKDLKPKEECQGKTEDFCDVCMEKRCEDGEIYG